MFADIKSYVDNCPACELTKPARGYLPMQIWVPSRFNQRVAIDPCGPFPKTSRGNVYCIVMVECFSKWVVAVPLKDICSATVYSAFLDHYVYAYGPPEELISDRGANMISHLAMEFCHEFGIKKIQTTSEHPQADPAERAIKTFKSILKKLVIEFKSDWDLHVQKAVYAMRSSMSRAHSFSPYEVVFGRQPLLPSYLEFAPDKLENPSIRSNNEVKIFQIVREKLTEQAISNKIAYDARHPIRTPFSTTSIVAGDHVMISTIRSKSALDARVHGPYLVLQYVSPTTVRLASLDGSKLSFHPVVNVNRLRKTSLLREEERDSLFLPDKSLGGFIPASSLPAPVVAPVPVIIPGPAPAQAPAAPAALVPAPIAAPVAPPIPGAQPAANQAPQDLPFEISLSLSSSSSSSEPFSNEEVVTEIVHHKRKKDGLLYFQTFFNTSDLSYWLPASNFTTADNSVVNETFKDYLEQEDISLEDALAKVRKSVRNTRSMKKTSRTTTRKK